jgi:hypothetical protein
MEEVISAIQYRERDIILAIEKSDAPWFIVRSISWVPKLLDSEKIKKAIGTAFSITKTPYYLLNVLKSDSHILLSKNVLKGITKALDSSSRFWLFLGHLKSVEPLITHNDIKKSIARRSKSISLEIRESNNPITMIQSMKDFPVLFEDESIQSAMLDVVLAHETPWKILHSLMDIERIAHIHQHPDILELMEVKGREVATQIEQTVTSPYGTLSDTVKIPELARTTAIRSLVCTMMVTSNYDDDSSYIGLLHSSDHLASHSECQEIVSRILIASERPWAVIEDVIYVPEKYDIWKEKYFLNSTVFSNALSYRIHDIVEAFRLFKDTAIATDFYFKNDMMRILGTVPQLVDLPAIDEILAECILESENPTELIESMLEYTSKCRKQEIQIAIAEAIKKSEHLMEIIRSLEKGEFLLEIEEIQDAIRYRSDDIVSSIEQGESISFKSKLTSIIDQEDLVDASIKRLTDAKWPDEVIGQIFASQCLATNKEICKGIANIIRTNEKPFEIIYALSKSSFPSDERWRALMDSDVMESISYQIRSTKYPSLILQKIGWNNYEHLFLTNQSIMDALIERVDDIAGIVADRRGLFYNYLQVINQIPVLRENEKIINAIANAIRDPQHFREIFKELGNSMREHKVILQALEDASDIFLKLLDTADDTEWLMKDAFHPVMLKNNDVVDWFLKNIGRLSNISPLINKETLEIPRLLEEILQIIRTTKAPMNFALAGQLVSTGFLEKRPDYQDEFEEIAEKNLLEVDEPWDLISRLSWIFKYFDTQKVQDIIKKLIPNILSAIRTSKYKQIDSMIQLVSKFPILCSNDEIIEAIATRVKDLHWEGLWEVARNETIFSSKSIQQALIRLIKETPELIEKLGIIHTEHLQSNPKFRNIILSRISDIVEEFLTSSKKKNG